MTIRQTPGEKLCQTILSVASFLKQFVSPTGTLRRASEVFHFAGQPLPLGRQPVFSRILMVENDPDEASAIRQVVADTCGYGEVTLFAAYGYLAALEVFETHGTAIDLVIMDYELDEDGDGGLLSLRFKRQRSDLVILANSGSAISNKLLMDSGAVEIIGKDREKLRQWLLGHGGLR